MAVNGEEIRKAFLSRNLEVDETILSECIGLCHDYNFENGDSLADRWDLFCLNNPVQVKDNSLNSESIVFFKSSLMEENAKKKPITQNKENIPMAANRKKQNDLKLTKENLGVLYEMKSPEKRSSTFQSPDGKKHAKKNSLFSPTSIQSPVNGKYENRSDAGETIGSFQPELLLNKVKRENCQRAVILSSENDASEMSYMYTPLAERAIVLDKQLVAFQESFGDDVEFGALGDPSPSLVKVVGRICCEAPEGKLNPSVVQLEGARKYCGGQRVTLDLSKVADFDLFPGKIVCVEGILNSARQPMVVKKFVEPCFAPMPKSIIKDIQTLNSQSTQVMIGCGPFTTSDNLEFMPLVDLIEVAKVNKPDVLVLIGPFIDVNHLLLKDGSVFYDKMIVSYQDIFLFRVVTLLDKLMESDENIQVVLVPSLREANHLFVYPQPPFDKKKLHEVIRRSSNQKRLHLLSNPSVFSINNTVFGISAIDVLFHLGSNELYRSSGQVKNRLIRLAEQVIDQKSFYPIFPPPASGDAPIDLRFYQKFQFQETPDILILPSMLKSFVGKIQESVCINPGQLSRGVSGGSFASVTIFPYQHAMLEGKKQDDSIGHFIPQRTSVELKRI